MKVLLTGFEPFGERKINNAWGVANGFSGCPDIDILKIPVSFKRAHNKVIELLHSGIYNLIVMVGETSFTKDYVRLERLAINYKDSNLSDNDGVIADDECLICNAPMAYFTKFPVKKTAEALKTEGYKVKVTNSTGTFVCNSLYFNILHYLATHNSSSTALFIHVPASEEVISVDEMKTTVKAIIDHFSEALCSH